MDKPYFGAFSNSDIVLLMQQNILSVPGKKFHSFRFSPPLFQEGGMSPGREI
jgi:hypothetical protein